LRQLPARELPQFTKEFSSHRIAHLPPTVRTGCDRDVAKVSGA
jgi:hypothetical protein